MDEKIVKSRKENKMERGAQGIEEQKEESRTERRDREVECGAHLGAVSAQREQQRVEKILHDREENKRTKGMEKNRR